MRTKYCPHCGSENIHRVEEDNTQFDVNVGLLDYPPTHYHECGDCNETWEHHKKR